MNVRRGDIMKELIITIGEAITEVTHNEEASLFILEQAKAINMALGYDYVVIKENK